MLDQIPLNCYAGIVRFLSQDDKVALTQVSKVVYERTVPFLYRYLFLNRSPLVASDLDDSLGLTNWSLLRFPFSGYKRQEHDLVQADRYFKLLVRSLECNVGLCHHIISIWCSWHIDVPTVVRLIGLLEKHGTTIQYFYQSLEMNIMEELSVIADRLRNLGVAPPSKLPVLNVPPGYCKTIDSLLTRYDWGIIRQLSLHVNASRFFSSKSKPLRIVGLTLNLRPDTFKQPPDSTELPLFKVFDVGSLKELRILSWYEGNDRSLNIYRIWRLYDFHKFKNITSLSLRSLSANDEFLTICAQEFTRLKTIKVDFLFDAAVGRSTLNAFRRAQCSRTLKFIDIKFDPLDAPLVSIDNDQRNFILTYTCRCSDCRDTFKEVLLKKYFPSYDSLRIRSVTDANARNFILQMFKLFPILPYVHSIDVAPAFAYSTYRLEEHVDEVNKLLRYASSNGLPVTAEDIVRLYHAHIHSLKKTYDHFLSSFPKLEFLVLNDLPTRVVCFEHQQKCNIPLFYSKGYKSNQKYVLVEDESLFD